MWHVQEVGDRRDATSSSAETRRVETPLLRTCLHGLVVLYYVVMNVLMSSVSMRLYEAGHPVTKMFLGGLTQFFTTWNQVFQQSYFALSLLEDVLGFSTCKSHAITCQTINAFRRRLFTPILLPSACLTFVNFWGIYTLVPHLMLDDLVAFYPALLNHVMHTFIVPLVYVELVCTPQLVVPRSTGFKDVTLLMAAYAFWVYLLGWLSDQWPYPFLQVMNTPQHAVFVPCMFLHGYFWYFVNDFFVRRVWGETGTEASDLKQQ